MNILFVTACNLRCLQWCPEFHKHSLPEIITRTIHPPLNTLISEEQVMERSAPGWRKYKREQGDSHTQPIYREVVE